MIGGSGLRMRTAAGVSITIPTINRNPVISKQNCHLLLNNPKIAIVTIVETFSRAKTCANNDAAAQHRMA